MVEISGEYDIEESGGTSQIDDEHADFKNDHNHCLVCYSELTVRGKTPCDHNDICGVCHLRLRHLHNDKNCPICKSTNETIIVDDAADAKRFDEYPLWGNELGAAYIFRESVGMFFPTTYYQTDILPLFGRHPHALSNLQAACCIMGLVAPFPKNFVTKKCTISDRQKLKVPGQYIPCCENGQDRSTAKALGVLSFWDL